MTTTMASHIRPGRPRLGEILVAAGILDESQLKAALAEQRKWGDRLGRTLVHMGFISEDALAHALSRQLQLPTCRPDRTALPPDVTDHLGVLACERYGVMPLGLENGVLRLATSDPSNAPLLDEVAAVVGLRVEPVIATESAIGLAIRKHYYGEPIDLADPPSPVPFAPMPVIDLSRPPALTPGSLAATPGTVDSAPRARSLRPPDAGRGVTTGGNLDFDVELAPESELAVAQLREVVDRLEDNLSREVRALRALVETLVDRGVITREEFLAHVRARAD